MLITKPVTTAEGVAKLAFYRVIGRETPTGEMVDTIDFVGEFTASELEQQKTQIQLQIDDLDEKLTHYIA